MNDLFLRLTHVETKNLLKDNMYGDSVFIDPTEIVTLTQMINHDEEVYTSIFMKGPVVVDVKETPEEISKKIIDSLTNQIEFEEED